MISSWDNIGVRMPTDEVELRAGISDLMGAESEQERARLASHVRGLGRLIGEYAVQYEKVRRKPMAQARHIKASRAG